MAFIMIKNMMMASINESLVITCLVCMVVFLPGFFGKQGECLLRAEEKEPGGAGIVARRDFDVGEGWRPKKIMGRDFWHILGISMDSHPDEGSWAHTRFRELIDRPLFKESGLNYSSIANITVPDSNKVSISAMALELATHYKHISPADAARYSKKYLSLIDARPNAPFFIMPHGIRPIYRLMKDFDCDYEGYKSWKNAHPNFMGCVNGETDNDFMATAPWKNYWWPKKKNTFDNKLIKTIEREFPKPRTREELAAQYMKACKSFQKFFFDDADKSVYMRAAHCHDHYFYESGAGMVWLETTNTASPNGVRNYRHRPSLFFTRGAARQYNKKWGWYIAVYYNGYDDKGEFWGHSDPDYRNDKVIKGSGRGGYHGPDCGASPSLLKRDAFLAYLSGASFVQHESWHGYMNVTKKDGQKTYDLSSPLGKVWEDWFEFTRKNPDRGVSYAPVALLVPFAQGYPNYGGKSWNTFDYGRPDWMIDAFMYTIMPHAPVTKDGDEGAMANSKHGDVFDVIVPDTPQKTVSLDVLNNYKAAAMLGRYPKSKSLAERLMQYVKTGGTLLINVEQLNEYFPATFTGINRENAEMTTVNGTIRSACGRESFDLPDEYECAVVTMTIATPLLKDSQGTVLACKNTFGAGNVIVSTVNWMVPKDDTVGKGGYYLIKRVYEKRFPFVEYFLSQFAHETLPVEIKGDIQYGMNKLDDGWIVYLINNKGVTKFTNKAQSLDMSKIARVEVFLRNIKAETITELSGQKTVPKEHRSNSFTIDVPPGDVRIIKIEERSQALE